MGPAPILASIDLKTFKQWLLSERTGVPRGEELSLLRRAVQKVHIRLAIRRAAKNVSVTQSNTYFI